ncbi:MAG: phosphatidylserine decarboxylase family protein [Prevotellaceae bacterium]|nr:phosphatidylserine decarboxylase family protein [Prevotellaceae bacterium]MDY3365097.1 phosphatidylserine decarboxylase family protein [Prevotella sp.]
MSNRIKKLKKVRIHREGTRTIVLSLIALAVISAILWFCINSKILFWCFLAIFGPIFLIIVNFYRCPIRLFKGETDKLIVAPADGKIVVIEEVEEKQYFKDKRLMVSIFMSPLNVHANWFPVDGKVKFVKHVSGNFHKAWLPKASEENERADTMITTPEGVDILCRQIAGAMARRIVTYAKAGDECFIDEHLGFIKLGSRVDLYLPLGTEIFVNMDESTVGNQTIIGRLQ